MASTVQIDLRHVARGLTLSLGQVQAVVELLDDGNTVPFITRYRKDQTGGLDEEQIRQVQSRLGKARQLAERKQTILRSIESQGKLTEQLAKRIQSAGTAKRLEDLYLPYKPKKQTLATAARARGLEPLAREILEADPACQDLDARAGDFVNPDREVSCAADALLGAGHILAERFSERADLRQRLREILQRTGKFVTSQLTPEPKSQPDQPKTEPPEPNTPSDRPKPASDGPAPGPQEPSPAETTAPETSEKDESGTAPTQNEEPGDAPADSTPTPDEGETPSEAFPGPSNPTPADPDPPDPDPPEADPPEPVAAEPEQPGAQPEPEQPGAAASDPAAQLPAEAESPAEPATATGPEAEPETVAEPPAQPLAETPSEGSSADAAGSGSSPAAASPPAAPPPVATSKAAQAKPPAPKLSKKELRRKRAEEKRIRAFSDYFDYSEELRKIPPHRLLAINRGERAKVLKVKVECDVEAMYGVLDELLVAPDHPHAEYLRGCARDALSRLILPVLEREARRELSDRAETHAVEVFAKNLRNLLLQPPVSDHRVLAVDPGFKSGCKLVALDQFGNVLEHGAIYLVGKPERREKAKQKVLELVERYELSVVAIGNGTACREAEAFFAEMLGDGLGQRNVAYVIVNEAGASVYSTSRIGREEFPEYDASLRGAISIGRRLLDPLSELVKIDAANIGVGLYQHDVKAKHLRTSLDDVVESCVNYVGVDVNTASPALLRYVSGLNQLTARRLYEYRRGYGPFRSRGQLKEVAGFGDATFVQAAGFLKITGGENPLDATWIHPESYPVAARVLEKLGCSFDDLRARETQPSLAERAGQLDVETTAAELGVGVLTLRDILAQLVRPGRDPRDDLPKPVFKHDVLKLEDLSPGMELTGTVLNVVDFGCFVDIGMHDSGLVHVSRLADKFVRDPHDVVAVGDVVKVWVMEVDQQRRRVSLSMVQPGTERARGGRRGERREGRGKGARPGPPQKLPAEGRPPAERRPPEGRRRRGKGPPRDRPPRRGKGAGRIKYEPKARRKPLTPITEDMKSGKEPMRTFGDLLQYYEHKQEGDEPKRPGREKPPKKKPKPPAPEPEQKPDEPPSAQDTPPVAEEAPPVAQDAPPVVEEVPPVAQDASAVVEEAPPPAQEVPPVVEEAPPVVQETPPDVPESAPEPDDAKPPSGSGQDDAKPPGGNEPPESPPKPSEPEPPRP